MHITNRQRDEYIARDFLTEEVWKAWKADYDSMMSFRKTIKGKPDKYDKAILDLHKPMLEFYDTVLWHSGKEDCTCRSCNILRSATVKLLKSCGINPEDINLMELAKYLEKEHPSLLEI